MEKNSKQGWKYNQLIGRKRILHQSRFTLGLLVNAIRTNINKIDKELVEIKKLEKEEKWD